MRGKKAQLRIQLAALGLLIAFFQFFSLLHATSELSASLAKKAVSISEQGSEHCPLCEVFASASSAAPSGSHSLVLPIESAAILPSDAPLDIRSPLEGLYLRGPPLLSS